MAANDAKRPAFLAFAADAADMAEISAFAKTHALPEDCVFKGGIAEATEHLKSNPSPAVLLVELPSAAEAPELLNRLADHCDAETKVIAIGAVNEYSFYCWLTELGISSYLLKPLSAQALESAWQKAHAPPPGAAGEANGRKPGRVIGLLGARGGSGATGIGVVLAALIAEDKSKKVALVDLDPQDGSVSLLLDMEASRGFREALEKPDRIDNLFIERVMNKTPQDFYILSAEESIADRVNAQEEAAGALLTELQQKFDIILLDLPRQISPFQRACLRDCETVVVVSEMTLLSLRDTLRIHDLFRDVLRAKPPLFVANKTGMAPKHEMTLADFSKGLGTKVEHSIPFAPEVFLEIGAEMECLKHKNSPALKALRHLAVHLSPVDEAGAEKEGAKGKLGFFKKGK